MKSSEHVTERPQRPSLESFLDEYQLIRLLVSLAGLVVVTSFVLIGDWGRGSPVPSLLVLGLMAGHAGWRHMRGVRRPKEMLLLDVTLLGGVLFTIPDSPSVMTGTLAFLALVVVLFTEGGWRVALLTYLGALYVAAFLTGVGVTVQSVGDLTGSLFAVAAMVTVVVRVRGWLDRLDGTRSQMLGTVGHELRNNLTGVLGVTELVSTTEGLEATEARELLDMAHQQALDATEIIEDLLTVSRVERSALTMSKEMVDVNAEVVTTSRRFHGTESDIGLLLADDLVPATADSLRVRQILRNLLSNALRYGGPGITVQTQHRSGTIEVIVRDNGEGVPPGEEHTIFLPYRRSTAGRRDPSSIGLGLWICRKLAQGMGGSLRYRRSGDSTEFVLTLPEAGREHGQPSAVASGDSMKRDRRSEGWGLSAQMRGASTAG